MKCAKDEPVYDRAYGALLGAFVGDALGVPLEFETNVTEQDVKQAIKLSGGGFHRVAPGQISDDSELALASLYGLLDSRGMSEQERLDKIATMYCRWIRSSPFDRGLTCTRAFSMQPDMPNIAEAMKAHVKTCNEVSKSNGALMRLAPLIVYAHKLSTKDLVEVVRQDAMLSHPNQTCQDVNAVFAVAVAHLINFPGDSVGAVRSAERFANEHANAEVNEWLALSADVDYVMTLDCCSALIGFVKWAFLLAFHHLRWNSSYIAAQKDVLRRGGDTDTNAAIVGCMIGALHGASKIPEDLKRPVLICKSNRPDWLQAYHLPKLFKSLYQLSCKIDRPHV